MTITMRQVSVRPTEEKDFDQIAQLCRKVYPTSPAWSKEQLASHRRVFPEGQLVAVGQEDDRVVGMSASLVIRWDEYDFTESWKDFTDHGMFTNHDPEGRTLYGAEIMVDPDSRGQGVGTEIYRARRDLVRSLRLLRIRAGARLRGYHRYAEKFSPQEYAIRVTRGEIRDPTLSFQLKRGFHVLTVVQDYLRKDPESHGAAAVIEWINREVAKPGDQIILDSDFERELEAFKRFHPEAGIED